MAGQGIRALVPQALKQKSSDRGRKNEASEAVLGFSLARTTMNKDKAWLGTALSGNRSKGDDRVGVLAVGS